MERTYKADAGSSKCAASAHGWWRCRSLGRQGPRRPSGGQRARELPGGVLEPDEEPQTGVAREVLEETGIEVAVGQLGGVCKNMKPGAVALVVH
ncbi:NUDIX hydrolase [Streptomyces populi]|uniref:NUDIX hydrolase n=1 Tax=Streptomyces populi TaxID=2058924 RepID=UPI0035E11D06